MNWPLITGVGHFIFNLFRDTVIKARGAGNRDDTRALGRGTDMVKCARCHTYVPHYAGLSAKVGGYTLHFCSKECFEAYRRDHQDIDAVELGGG